MQSERGESTGFVGTIEDVTVRKQSEDELRESKQQLEHALEELQAAPPGAALEIPLSEVGIELANLRSAVHRASAGSGITIETLADERNFYVWRKDALSQK